MAEPSALRSHRSKANLSSEAWEHLEPLLERFEDAWRRGERPAIEVYLRAAKPEEQRSLLIELVHADLDYHLQAGETARVEDYLNRYPQLHEAPSAVIGLVQAEHALRRERGEVLSAAEYVERFPQYQTELLARMSTVDESQLVERRQENEEIILSDKAPGEEAKRGRVQGEQSAWESTVKTDSVSIPGYELLEELGRGGMGVVYRARDRKRGCQVALKTIQAMTAEALYRFKQEFRLRADLHHVNLVRLFELIAEDGRWFFTMELVQGRDFLSHVRGGSDRLNPSAGTPLSTAEQYLRLRQVLRQLVNGVEALHSCRRLHRDLKPSNVMVSLEGRVVLLDFGLVTQLGPQLRHESTERHLLGTVAYMSPEQARSESLSPASDWYSVGVMLYEALTGRLPFGGSVFQILSDKQRMDPPPPHTLASGIPEDLDSLCASLLSRDPAARPGGSESLRLIGGRPGERAPSPEVLAPEVMLVGRGEQLAELADAYAASRNRRTVTLFLSGPSGIGKSSLLQQFLSRLAVEAEAVVLTGQCYEQESVPYKAFDGVIDALGRFLRHLPPLEVQALLPRDVASLCRMFPTLRRVEALLSVPQGREVPDPQEMRQRAFASLRELLARLADRKPVVICIDDLQWGDSDSAALLTELIRPPDAPSFLFIGCHRSEEGANPFLTALAESNRFLWSEVDRREMNLDPLSIPEAKELAVRLLPSLESKDDYTAEIARESGGIPFIVYELVRYLRAEGGRSLKGGAIDLREVLWSRIELLPAEAKKLLAVVALAARPLPQDVACRAAGLAEGRIEELTQLRSQRLARGTGMSGEDLLVTYHDRIREIFRTRLCAEDARGLHASLAEALESWGRADAEWLATHWEYAGEKRRAGEYYARAADQAAETLAFDNAADLYQRALDIGVEDASLHRQLQRKLGDALANAGRGGEAARLYRALLSETSGLEAIELQRKVTEQFLISGHIDEGFAAARSLIRSVGMTIPRTPLQACIKFLLMRVWLWFRGIRFDEGYEAKVSPSDLCRVDVSWTMGRSLGLIDPIQGAYFQTKSLLLALRSGEPYRVARALTMESAYIAIAGPSSHSKTCRMLAAGEALAQRLGNLYLEGLILLIRGTAAYLEGRWRNSVKECSLAEEHFRNHCAGFYWELNTAQAFHIWSLVYLGALDAIRNLCPRLISETQSRGDLHGTANLVLFPLPLLQLAHDNAEEGYRELLNNVSQWSRGGFNVQQTNSLFMKCQLLLYLDHGVPSEQAASQMQESMKLSRISSVQHMRISMWEVTARASIAAARQVSSSESYLQAAERNARQVEREHRLDAQSLARLIRAGIASCRGDLESAKGLLEQALSGLDTCELGLFAAAARRRLGQLLGGDQGKTLVAEADRWMSAQGIRNPTRMTAVYAPGFPDS
jgi:tetratricopeptide (TPR) repeat protein